VVCALASTSTSSGISCFHVNTTRYPNYGVGNPKTGEATVWKSLLVDSEPPLSGDIDAKGSTVCFVYALPNGTQGGCYDSMRDIWSFLDSDFLAIPTILVKVALNDDGSHACFLLLNSQNLVTYLVCADVRSIPISLKSVIPYFIFLSLWIIGTCPTLSTRPSTGPIKLLLSSLMTTRWLSSWFSILRSLAICEGWRARSVEAA